MSPLGMFGGGGYAAQGADPKLGDKIAALKQKRGNPDEKVTQFLERDLGIDRSKLPFTPQIAREHLTQVIENSDADSLDLWGNSMGLTSVECHVYDDTSVFYDDTSDQWPDLVKAHTALRGEFPASYSFEARRNYPDLIITQREPPSPKHENMGDYPTGSVLRIERARREGDVLVVDSEYVRIGGLFDDATPTFLETMKPVGDTDGWTVSEHIT